MSAALQMPLVPVGVIIFNVAYLLQLPIVLVVGFSTRICMQE